MVYLSADVIHPSSKRLIVIELEVKPVIF